MFKCWKFTTSINTKLLFRKHGRGNKRQERKLVLYENNLASNVLLLLVLFLCLSIHCIEVAQCGQVSPSSVTGLGKSIASPTSSGKDGGSARGSSGVTSTGEDGELLSHHTHHHNNHNRHHRHSSSGKNSPQSASSSSSTSFGYQHEYNPLSYYNSADSYYEPRQYDRPSREFSARSTSYPAMAVAASTSQVGFAGEPEYGGLALATGHGGGHGGHGGHGHNEGYGHGHGHHTTYYKTVNKVDQSSLGLLGLLGLLSLLSNVLMLLTTTARTTTMGMGMGRGERLKRDTMMLVKVNDEEAVSAKRRSVVEHLSHLILPSLNVVGHAKDGRIPLNCTYQEVCKTNKVLVQVFGADDGRPVASVLSTAIIKLLTNNANNDKYARRPSHYKSSFMQNGIGGMTSLQLVKKFLKDAGNVGRNGGNCELMYPTCNALSITNNDSTVGGTRDSSRLPFLISPEHALAIIMGQRG